MFTVAGSPCGYGSGYIQKVFVPCFSHGEGIMDERLGVLQFLYSLVNIIEAAEKLCFHLGRNLLISMG